VSDQNAVRERTRFSRAKNEKRKKSGGRAEPTTEGRLFMSGSVTRVLRTQSLRTTKRTGTHGVGVGIWKAGGGALQTVGEWENMRGKENYNIR